jgi:hypothetical protein
VSKRLGQETYFIWNTSHSPLWHGPGSPFSNKVNALAEKFAIRAIEAQPGAYLSAVWHSTYLAFRRQRDATPEGQSQNLYMFPAATPESVKALGPDCQYACYKEVYSYAGGRNPSTAVVQPFAGWIRIYQRLAIVSGPLLGLIVLAGLAGFGLAWRRIGNPVQLPWLVGVATIVVPAATASFDARYLVASIPALCIAAALGVQEVGEAGRAAIARRRPPPRPAPDADAALA